MSKSDYAMKDLYQEARDDDDDDDDDDAMRCESNGVYLLNRWNLVLNATSNAALLLPTSTRA
jgi:hypothetical protein